ncbi:RtcB family protein [Candidatus Saccharibacteria bacterium]|nr:RtcB family protein [Candidatus Saccharibacteria bacterium]
MVKREDVVQAGPYVWEIPKSYRADMLVPAIFFASPKMFEDAFKDRSLAQLVNVACLPGVVKYALAMPDMHQGYGFPIGGVAASRLPDGAISPGGIGYDINCGVRLLLSDLGAKDLRPAQETLAHELSRAIPAGTGRGGRFDLKSAELDKVLNQGVRWALKNGYASQKDLEHTESEGRLQAADATAVSVQAKNRGQRQLGTLGAGNHFAEVGVVQAIFDEKIAESFGLKSGQITVLIHSGSRGLGHQVGSDYIKLMQAKMPEFGIEVPDRELACLPFSSELGQKYYAAMSAAANYAWVNRQLLTCLVRQVWQNIFGGQGRLELLYDVAHNIAKVEEYEIDGALQKVLVQRKGATRAFGPGQPEIPKAFRGQGQPVIIPGSMGTASYVLVGTKGAMSQSFGSTCHGSGRAMSRHGAKKLQLGKDLQAELAKRRIIVKTPAVKYLSEEAPYAYKDVDEVVDIVQRVGIAKKVARLLPLIVIKG